MVTFPEWWADFEKRTVPTGVSDAQKRDMRTCFYAGAVALLGLIERQAVADPEGDEINEFIKGVKAELVGYFDDNTTEQRH